VPNLAVPPALARNAVDTWGAEGERWLGDLPALLAAIAADWQLTLGPPYMLSFHWVCPATRADGSPAVLKVGPPGPGHLAVEAATLRLYRGRGAVRLLAYHAGRGALLLERAEPGTLLRTLVPHRDEEATATLVDVMRRLHQPPPSGCPLPDLAGYREGFTGYLRRYPGDGPLPRHLVERAARLFDELCASATERVVLHGDLHHDNVLRGHREPWLAIDPHGLVGDPGYDTGALLYNPDPRQRDEELLALVPARVEQLADGLRVPVERVVGWGFVQGVLSEVWDAQATAAVGGRPLDVAMSLLPRLP
jgi:streptomycin 6-kinase